MKYVLNLFDCIHLINSLFMNTSFTSQKTTQQIKKSLQLQKQIRQPQKTSYLQAFNIEVKLNLFFYTINREVAPICIISK